MLRRRTVLRASLALAGAVVGFACTALALLLYFQELRRREFEARASAELGLPRDAFEVERVERDGRLVLSLRDVVFLDSAGNRVLAAPTVRARFDAGSLNRPGMLEFDQVEIRRPTLELRQNAAGAWTVFDIFAVTAAGDTVVAAGDEEARPLAFRGVRIVDGTARVLMPYTPPDGPPPGRFARAEPPERTRTPGGPTAVATVHRLTDIQARLPLIRTGGNAGWRVEIGDLTARVRNPDTRILAMSGWFEDRGDDLIRLEVDALRTTHSSFAARGTIGVGGETPVYDVDVLARTLDFRDLAGMGLPIPDRGEARFALAIETLDAARTRWTATDAEVAVLDSRASGRLTAVTGGETVVFGDTRLLLDPLRLEDLRTLGYVDSLFVDGTVTGTVAADGATAEAGALRVDLRAALVPSGRPGATASVLTAVGGVGFGEAGVRLEDLRVETPGLQLATFAGYVAPERAEMLRGAVTGGVTLNGTLASLRLADGRLTYQVGNAPASTLAGLRGTVSTEPTLRYSLEADAEPLELATLTALFPALPFRPATLSGPVALSGEGDDLRFSVDLAGAAGAFALSGTATLGEPTRFAVRGSVEAFRAPAVFAVDAPVSQPVTGTFGARGTVDDFAFDVNLTQGDTASLALAGGARRAGEAPYAVNVSGDVRNFRVGALFGRPDLLPGPVTGPIAVSGGGGAPYRFDVDLRGPDGVLALAGTFAPGDVPTYAVRGEVRGLDLSGLPFFAAFPPTRLNGTLLLDGRGTTPETFQGRIAFEALEGSTVVRQPLTEGVLRAVAEGGVLRVERMAFALQGGARFEGTGSLGLTTPVEDGLRFSLSVPDLGILGPLLPPAGPLEPDAAGALAASGVVNGTLARPALAVNATANGVRYDAYRAGTLAVSVRATKVDSAAWTANGTVEGSDLLLGPGQPLAALRLEANVTPTLASFGMTARRDATTDLAASGEIELADGGVVGAILQTARLRLDGRRWALADRARLAWSGDRGLQIENLYFREEDGPGFLIADGTLPPAGVADLTVRLSSVSLAQLRPLAPRLVPDLRGVFGGEVVIAGPVSDPELRVDLRVDSLGYAGASVDSARVTALYRQGRMDASAAATARGRTVLTASAGIPMRLDLGGIVPTLALLEDGALRVELRTDSLPLALIANAVPQLRDGRGVLDADVAVTGTPADPVVRGLAVVDSGGFHIVPLDVTWHSVQGRVTLEGETIRVERLVARTEEDGVAEVQGTIRLDDPRQPEVYLTLTADNFQAVDTDDLARIEMDAAVALSGRLPDAVASGTLRVDDATIYIPRFGEEGELDIVGADVGQIGADTLQAGTGAAALFGRIGVRDFDVTIGEDVWLESPDARIQIGGAVGVTRVGTGLPALTGDLEARRGTFNLSFLNGLVQREFEIVEGRVQFFGTPDFNPALDITARHEVRAREPGEQPVIVDVRVAGTVQNPRVELSSTTSRVPIPESELVSLLIFGRRSTELATLPTDLVQAQVLSEVIAGYFLGGLEQAVVRTGWVDYVRVRAVPTQGGGAFGGLLGSDGGPLAALSVELGKQIFNDVFLAVEVAGLTTQAPQIGASLDWEVSRTWSLSAAVEPVRRDPLLNNLTNLRRQVTVELRRRWEYGRPETRDPVEPETPTEEPRPAERSAPTSEPLPAPPE